MLYRVYGTIHTKGKLTGYRIIDENGASKYDLKVADAKRFIKVKDVTNADVDYDGNIVLTETSIKRLPYLETTNNIVYNNTVSIICKFVGRNGVCFKVVNGYGTIAYKGLDEILRIKASIGLSNARAVNYRGSMVYISGLRHSIPTYGLDLDECLIISLVSGYKVTLRDGDFLLLDENDAIEEISMNLEPKWLAPLDEITYNDLLLGYHNTCVTFNNDYSKTRHKELMKEIGTGFTWLYKSFISRSGDKFYLLEKKVASKTMYGGVGLYSKTHKRWVIPPYFELYDDNIRQISYDLIVGGIFIEDPLLKLENDELLWILNMETGVRSSIRYSNVTIIDENTISCGVFTKGNVIKQVLLDRRTLQEISDDFREFNYTDIIDIGESE